MLYICPTPIGNLEDITLRVLRVLSEVDLVAAEDTRHTRKLLNHFEIKTPLMSVHEHNEFVRSAEIVELLRQGKSIALVSDAGTPGISDPGAIVIRQVIESGLEFTVLPGANAAITALVSSGMTETPFSFVGFLPRKAKERIKLLEELQTSSYTLVFYEAPHRLVRMLDDMYRIFGERQAVVARELTKKFEEIRRGTLKELIEHFRSVDPKGEFVVISAGFQDEQKESVKERLGEDDIRIAVEDLVMNGFQKKEAIKMVALRHRLPRNEVYQTVLELDPIQEKDKF